MSTEHEKIPLRWYHLRSVKLTGEYIGGILAGFGAGISLMAIIFTPLVGWSLIWLLGLLLMPIGSGIALHAQGRYTTNPDDEPSTNSEC